MLKISKWLRSTSYIATTVVVATIGGCGEENSTPCRPGNEQGWCWQNPRPQGNPLLAVAATADGTRAFAVGAQGTVIRTGNSGANWIWLPSPTNKTLWDVALRGNTSLWAVGDEGTFIRSTDAGLTWTPISATSNTLLNVQMVNATTGYASGYRHTFLKTTDGGATWSSSGSFPAPSYYSLAAYDTRRAAYDAAGGEILVDMQFLNTTTGWAIGVDSSKQSSWGTTWKTTNGGSTWSEAIISSSSNPIVRIRFKDASLGVALAMDGTTYLTIDGGITWSHTGDAPARTGSLPPDNPVLRVHGNRVIAGADYSDDGGATWQVDSALRENAISSTINTASTANVSYGVGAIGQLLYSADNGVTWTKQHYGSIATTSSLTSVDVLSNNINRGWAVGTGGRILRTINGKDWTVQSEGGSTTMDFTAVKALNMNVAIAIGGGASGIVVKRTLDGGVTWSSMPVSGTLPPNPNAGKMVLQSISFTGTNGWVAGSRGTILKTSNNGASWSSVSSPAFRLASIPDVAIDLKAVKFVSATEGYIAGTCSQPRDPEEGNEPAIENSPYDLDPESCGYIRHQGQETPSGRSFLFVMKTIDGGISWDIKNLKDSFKTSLSMDFPTTNDGYLTADDTSILDPMTELWKTSDAGATWTSISLSSGVGARTIRFADVNTGWIVGITGSSSMLTGDSRGLTGSIWKTTDAGSTWTRQPSGSPLPLVGLHVYDAQNARVVGFADHILATSNGGVITP